ncbi:MAG TPA: hypothetical protein PK095_14780, partial [Myxococcota bacterium]|nr:hypothetical protein [Myxococcota bacterium]
MPLDVQGQHFASSLHAAAIEGWAVGLILAFFFSLFGVAAYLDRKRLSGLERAWADAARRHGLARLAKFELRGKVGERSVAAHLFSTGSGNRYRLWTHVSVTGGITRALALGPDESVQRVLSQEVVLGDDAFERVVEVQGDEAVALALLDQDTRLTFLGAVQDGWSLEDGCWTFKGRENLGETLVSLIQSGLNLVEMTIESQSEFPRRLRAMVTEHPNPKMRRRALNYLLLQYPDLAETKNALDAASRDIEAVVRLLAADRLSEIGLLDAIVASALNEPPVRVDALESMVRNDAADPRTRWRVTEWLATDVPPPFRRAALEAVARVAVPDAEGHLIAALDDPDDELKLLAKKTLAAVGTV